MDPKLIAARAEIEAVMKKHDIAGYVVLHNAPDQVEFVLNLTPSYSKLQALTDASGQTQFKIQSKAADYPDGAAHQDALRPTSNMLYSITHQMLTIAEPLSQLSRYLDEKAGFTQEAPVSTQGRGH